MSQYKIMKITFHEAPFKFAGPLLHEAWYKILCLHPVNERRRYNRYKVAPSLIGWGANLESTLHVLDGFTVHRVGGILCEP